MKRLLVVIVIPLVVAGCGTNVGIVTATPEGAARQTCREEGFMENVIDSFFVFIEVDRDDGFTKSEELLTALNICESDVSGSCINCLTAMIDAVYP